MCEDVDESLTGIVRCYVKSLLHVIESASTRCTRIHVDIERLMVEAALID